MHATCAADEKERYKWKESEQNAFAARESGLYHTHKPVVSYDVSELAEPLGAGEVSMWLMCAGLLGNVYFTLPLAQNNEGQYVLSTMRESAYSVYGKSTTPGLTYLEDFVLQASHDALLTSPFYRHYSMHHLPSDSVGCPDVAAEAEVAGVKDFYTFADTPPGSPLPQGYLHNVTVPRKGFLAGLLGDTSACFCGFSQQSTNSSSSSCQLPGYISVPYYEDEEVTQIIQRGGYFEPSDNALLQKVLSRYWLGTWDCPELQFSDHWGIIRNWTSWMTSEDAGQQLDAADYLETGYGGIRAGTVEHVMREAKQKITPKARTAVAGNRFTASGSPVTGHTRCERNRASMRPESLADRFVNDLFPAAQAVVDSPAVSYCMRYAIELARANAIILLKSNTSSSAEQVMASLSGTVASWKHKCAAQIDLLGVCATTRALDVVSDPYLYLKQELWPTHCPFKFMPTGNLYSNSQYGLVTTPGCLVYHAQTQKLYDPCRVLPCNQSSSDDPFVLLPEQCRNAGRQCDIQQVLAPMEMPFHPMSMVDKYEVRGTWPAATVQQQQEGLLSALKQEQERQDDLRRDMPSRLASLDLFRRALLDQEAGGVGSPNSFPGAAPVGVATEETGTRHCDMVQVLSLFLVQLCQSAALTCFSVQKQCRSPVREREREKGMPLVY